jgi:3-oxoacyl-[acyl-carrier protein] reductase
MTAARVAVITGATGGLGRALAADLSAAGWSLALLGTSAERLSGLVAELGLAPERTHTATAQLRDAEAAERALASVLDRFGRVDGWVHVVGGWTGGTSIVDSSDEPYTSMLDQHLWTTLNVCRALVPAMVEAGFGRIVAVTSPQAAAPDAGASAYAVGKAAQETLLAALAREVAGSGVTVNVLRVRSIDARGQRGSDAGGTNAGATTPAEIAAAVRYLFSDEARVVTGQRIGLYGGPSPTS